jgi:hypothetical protein
MVVPRQADGMNDAAAYIGGTDQATSARRAVALVPSILVVEAIEEGASARLAAG